MNRFNKILLAAGSVAGLMAALASPAAAAPIFTINPHTGIPGYIGADGPADATDIHVSSSSIIRQTGANTQTEDGYAYVTSFTNNGSDVSAGLLPPGGPSFLVNSHQVYGLYFTYSATVTGLSAIGVPGTGVIAPGAFTFTLYADPNYNNSYTGASLAGGGTAGSISNTGDDIVLATGSSVAGGAGFQDPSGAPTINSINSFLLTPAGLSYFTSPDPFYNLSFLSATAGSFTDLQIAPGGSYAVLNGISATVNFLPNQVQVPEPLTLSLFGAGLAGAAVLRRRRESKKA